MDANDLVNMCVPSINEAANKKKKKKTQTEKFTSNKGKRVGFPGYAYDSHVGSRMFAPFGHFGCAVVGGLHAMPAPAPIATAPAPCACDCGGGCGGDCGGGMAGEAVDIKKFNGILESFAIAHPESDVVKAIQTMFNNVANGDGQLYHGCDGMDTTDGTIDLEKDDIDTSNARPTDKDQISALAASCEAALNAFKTYTGYDYIEMRSR